jgi:hypothetical protein
VQRDALSLARGGNGFREGPGRLMSSGRFVFFVEVTVYFLAVAVISICPAPTSLATTTVVRVDLGSLKVAL